MLYFDDKKFWADVLEEIEKPDTATVCISSFGVYAGISDTGENTAEKWKMDQTLQRILNSSTRLKKFAVLFSEAETTECTPDCAHCKAKQAKRDRRLQQHIAHWPQVSWFMTSEHHLKAVIVTKDDGRLVAWTGGRNFTTSNWADCSIKVVDEDAALLKEHVVKLMKEKSVPVK